MSRVEPGGAATDTGDACRDCALADGPGCCGGHGVTLLRSDRSVLALAGVVVAIITLAALSVPTSRHPAVLAPAVPSLAAAVATSVAGWVALARPGPAGQRAAATALRVLPVAVAGLLLTVAIALIRAVGA